MSVWVAVGLAGVVAAGLRVAFVAGNRRLPVPAWFDRASVLIAPAFTAALVATRAFTAGGAPTLGPDAVAIVLAVPIALRTRSIPVTLAVGMPLVWLLRALW